MRGRRSGDARGRSGTVLRPESSYSAALATSSTEVQDFALWLGKRAHMLWLCAM